MQYRLLDSLGTDDARKCNKDFGASLDITPKKLAKGEVIELNDRTADFLTGKYKALLEPVSKVKGDAKKPEITGPAKE